ncbi:MAG: SUF system NifU family Fe-S cluster assembly protein [Gammaproteobacteria bacterium]|nr:SUF system NifU family Fe-S cluster assembly protein [Gammaproteobacteria bacterium]
MSDELMQIYQKTLLEHSRNPHHFGSLKGATHTAEGFNPLCGDKITIYLNIDTEKLIIEASHETSACAICTSSASMMTDAITQLSLIQAEELCQQVDEMLKSDTPAQAPDMPIQSLEGVRAYPSRVKCATLPWGTLLAALSGKPNTTTEQEA